MFEENSSKPLKYRIHIPDADDKLVNICKDAAKAKYGKHLPEAVQARLEQELKAIKENNYASIYLIGAMLAKQSMLEGCPVATRGMIGSSFVVNLCGITAVNPLPAHYWCPKCHHFEVYYVHDYKVMGYDLPDKACPECGAVLNAEGADIDPEILMGIGMDRKPDIALNVAGEIRPKLVEYLKDTLGDNCVFRASVKALLKDGTFRRTMHPGGVFILPAGTDIRNVTEIRDKIPDDDFNLPVTERDYHELDELLKFDLLRFDELSMLAILEKHTGLSAKQIRTNDKEVLKVFHEEGLSFLPKSNTDWEETVSLQDRVIKDLKPEHFSDLVRITAMLHGVGVWKDNTEQLIQDGRALSDCISTRDDVMQEMLSHGIPRMQAFDIMERVRKGKGVTKDMERDMLAAGISEWYIDSSNKISYLYPRSQAVDYMLVGWKLAFFRLRFPEEYKNALEAVEGKA